MGFSLSRGAAAGAVFHGAASLAAGQAAQESGHSPGCPWARPLLLRLFALPAHPPSTPPLPALQDWGCPSGAAPWPLLHRLCELPALSEPLWIPLCVFCIQKPQEGASVWLDRHWALGHALQLGY